MVHMDPGGEVDRNGDVFSVFVCQQMGLTLEGLDRVASNYGASMQGRFHHERVANVSARPLRPLPMTIPEMIEAGTLARPVITMIGPPIGELGLNMAVPQRVIDHGGNVMYMDMEMSAQEARAFAITSGRPVISSGQSEMNSERSNVDRIVGALGIPPDILYDHIGSFDPPVCEAERSKPKELEW